MRRSGDVPALVGGRGVGDRAVRGSIRRRLLVNALVDPDEAASRLPAGLRPHVTELGTVVGCCLLEIGGLRPAGLPAALGITLRAAAHRISVEWAEGRGELAVGVYVPVRHTDSRLAVALGGRWFPGVHLRASVGISETPNRLTWLVGPADRASEFGIRVAVSMAQDSMPTSARDPVGGTCLGAALGLSPDRHGILEAARMDPDHHLAHRVEVEEVHSAFLSGFSTAKLAPALLMRDVGVTWTPARRPVLTLAGAPA